MLVLCGCATPPERFERRVAEAGLTIEVVHGAAYRHLIVRKPGRTGPLHVYIEGDGTPWRSFDTPAADPTPRVPLAFTLMLADPQASIYLGRPCYFGIPDPACRVEAWTDQRYSEATVESMSRALDAAIAGRPGGRVWLLGHSGGGVLGVLLARRRGDVARVVTVGANLDVAGWTAWHGYTPLAGSLDPARLASRPGPPEHHFVGSDDRVVPPAIVRAYATDRPAARVVEWPGFGHLCCWQDAWTRVLATLPAD